MEIPYTVTPRPDTGLANPKLGIWLFLASEVMLFGGLFSAYIFLRIGAEPGDWPTGLLNVPVGAMNTAILIASSVTVVLAWASLKMRKLSAYKLWMGISILCGAIFLIVKLAYEWPQKFEHFGAYLKKDSVAKYEQYLGNEYIKEKNAKGGTPIDPRGSISGHLHEVELTYDPGVLEKITKDTGDQIQKLEARLKELDAAKAGGKLTTEQSNETDVARTAIKTLSKKLERLPALKFDFFLNQHHLTAEPDPHDAKMLVVKGHQFTPGVAEDLEKLPGVKYVAFGLGLDPINAKPTDPESDKAHFWYKGPTEMHGKIEREDVRFYSAFAPKHNSYFAIYFTITGLHGLHVLAGVIVMFYFWLPIEGGTKMFRRNPEQLANRVEVVGLFWHFVDLVWIFVFPIFYLL